jgi:uncharacterized membrane-anchored protein
MRHDRLDQVLQDAIAAGVLPASAVRPVQENRPWPVVLLTALGSWLAAIPILIVVGLMLSDVATRGAGSYIVGVLALTGAVMLLRARTIPLFVEQLGVPALMVGGGLLGFGLFRDLPNQAAAAVLALIVAGVVWAVPMAWLRVLLGVVVAVFSGLAFLPRSWNFFERTELSSVWFALHAILAIWLIAGWLQRNVLNTGANARFASAWESLSVGWLLVTLAGLAFWSGMTFLVGASMGGGWVNDVMRELGPKHGGNVDLKLLRLTSVALAAGAVAWLQFCWPAMRQVWCAGAALVCIVLAWFMPALGAVLLALAFCVSGGRWRVASAAGLAAAWIIGAFYYQLSWPFATKALVMVGAGAVLGALTWLAWLTARKEASNNAPEHQALSRLATRKVQAGIAFGALAVLLVVNVGIWQKEDLIAHGAAVYVELRPVDPRSLMQGDYMQLNFAVPGGFFGSTEDMQEDTRPHVIARHEAGGVAKLLRMEDDKPLAPEEFRIELSPKNGQWVLVTDAWFFKEGQGARWAKAKYGEFRVAADGRALLVGLRGENLQEL